MLDLQRIKELLKQATPGPWHKTNHEDNNCPVIWAERQRFGDYIEVDPSGYFVALSILRESDLDLIVALRNNAEKLIEQIEELERLWSGAECRCSSLDAELDIVKAERDQAIANNEVLAYRLSTFCDDCDANPDFEPRWEEEAIEEFDGNEDGEDEPFSSQERM